jgi:hypothetical protein
VLEEGFTLEEVPALEAGLEELPADSDEFELGVPPQALSGKTRLAKRKAETCCFFIEVPLSFMLL